jgi:glycosyltransferase involved in cell wall biosynthesis
MQATNDVGNSTQTSETGGILLSICIPTYNRPKDFQRMFRRLLPQLTSEVEVVVRDDSSNLETQEYFNQSLLENVINYQYYKDEKIGVDAANLFLIEKASGKYIWWFSDDDEMLPGAISRVLELIKKFPELSFIWANFDYEKEGNPAIERDDGFFKNRNEVLETLGAGLGLMSTLIFKTEEALLSLPAARKHIVGFSFAGLVPIFTILSGTGKFYFMNGPYILCHPTTLEVIKEITTKTGEIKNEAFNVFGVHFYNIVKEFEGKFSKRAIRKILTVNFSHLWRGMLVGRIGGWETPRGKLWKMFKLYWSFPEFWVALPLLLMPLWLNKILYKVYKVFFSHRKFVFGKKVV